MDGGTKLGSRGVHVQWTSSSSIMVVMLSKDGRSRRCPTCRSNTQRSSADDRNEACARYIEDTHLRNHLCSSLQCGVRKLAREIAARTDPSHHRASCSHRASSALEQAVI